MKHEQVSSPPFVRRWIENRYYRRLWQTALTTTFDYPPGRFKGRGLVFCVGGESLFVNLWTNLCLLRRILKCQLPIEIWHFGENELTPAMRSLLAPFNAGIVDGEAFTRDLPHAKGRGFALKTLAIIHSSFEEVLFLDADNFAVRDPAFLFDEWPYRWAGACFWPDVWETDFRSAIWSVLKVPFVAEFEWETGQLIIDKSRAWKALNLVDHLTHYYPFYYRLGHGDKITFYGAWRKWDQPYAMPRHAPRLVASPDTRTLINQFDFHGQLLFQHRTTSEWRLSDASAGEGPKSVHEDLCLEFLKELREKWADSDRNTVLNREGPRERLILWRGLQAGWPVSRRTAESPVSISLGVEKWDAMSYQALISPHVVSPLLMGKGIEALRNSTEEEALAIIRFFAVQIFVDPRLAGMLPHYLETEDTALQKPWEELKSLIELTAVREDKTGLLSVRGNLMSSRAPTRLHAEEKKRIRQLMNVLSGSKSTIWKECSKFWQKILEQSEDLEASIGDRTVVTVPMVRKPWRAQAEPQKVLVLTPLKNASDLAEAYCQRLSRMNYPSKLLSLGLLESDSRDQTYQAFDQALDVLKKKWSRVNLWKHDYHYQVPEGFSRWQHEIQLKRRAVLAHSRNELLARALRDEDWVLWLDADVIDYPRDIIEQLLSYGKEILQPHCVMDYGGKTFDHNAWREKGLIHMEDLRGRELLAPLDAVGGTMLLIRACLHRRGLIFPTEPYGANNPRIRSPDKCWDPERPGEIETEGLGIMASDMNVQCWGLPEFEILHRKR